MGSKIKGKGSETLHVKGLTSLSGATHSIIPDRIEMGTYVIAGCFPGNHITVDNCRQQYISSLLKVLKSVGIKISVHGEKCEVEGGADLSPADVETLPYPGFPTDLQAQLTTLLTQAHGISTIKENIFNDRFQHTRELNKLGANIEVKGDVAFITGKSELQGRDIRATDLRASAALVLGGLIAQGQTVVSNAYQLFRGYEDMPKKIKKLGGRIKII
jgi:UDP-N-acetylglucosamine 1-carboxyvinyltransferase